MKVGAEMECGDVMWLWGGHVISSLTVTLKLCC